MKEKDLKIISKLRENSRMSLTEMSKKTNIPISTLYDRLKVFEGELVDKFTLLINFGKIGYKARAKILIGTERDCKNEIRNFLLKHENVNNFYKINSSFDFLFEVVFKDIQEISVFLDELESKFNITKKEIHYITEDLKREGFGRFPVIAGEDI